MNQRIPVGIMISHLREGAYFQESHIGMIEEAGTLKILIAIETVNMTTQTDWLDMIGV